MFAKVFIFAFLASASAILPKEKIDIQTCIKVLKDYVDEKPTPSKIITEDYGKVCYGATRNTHGKFAIKTAGTLVSLKLEHLTGAFTCNKYDKKIAKSYWGCATGAKDGMTMGTVITTPRKDVILPKPGATVHNKHWFYKLPPYDINSPVVILEDKTKGITVEAGEILRIYYAEDLTKYTTEDNHGTHCVRVTANILVRPQY